MAVTQPQTTGRPWSPAGRAAVRERIVVGIATRGRPDLLVAIIARLERQTVPIETIVVAATSPADVTGLSARPGLTILIGPPGLARQRNAILRSLPDGTDIVAFFDDDFVAHDGWLEGVTAAFRSDPRIACVTGAVAADGIIGPGIPFAEACRVAEANAAAGGSIRPGTPYGCNMAFRRSALGALTFDERLVLYGWLEDYDFGGALRREGWRLMRTEAARGVHMGVKRGRMPGHKLGYSQIMNPAYLLRKGTARWSDMADIVLRNLASNLVKSIRPEPYVDRRGRLRGNLIAVLDLCRGRLTPERAGSL